MDPISCKQGLKQTLLAAVFVRKFTKQYMGTKIRLYAKVYKSLWPHDKVENSGTDVRGHKDQSFHANIQ